VASGFDYIRFVEPTREVWMTEPDDERIEIFTVGSDARKAPDHAAYLATPGGPESLVVDRTRGRAYTHQWNGATYSIDIHTRTIVETWPNGCSGSRGIALDEARGFLFVGCREGRAVTLDVTAGGQKRGQAATGTGVDIIDYDAQRHHLYFPAGGSATLTILQVALDGSLTVLGTRPSVEHGHCGAVLPGGPVLVCDPDNGQLLVEEDPFP